MPVADELESATYDAMTAAYDRLASAEREDQVPALHAKFVAAVDEHRRTTLRGRISEHTDILVADADRMLHDARDYTAINRRWARATSQPHYKHLVAEQENLRVRISEYERVTGEKAGDWTPNTFPKGVAMLERAYKVSAELDSLTGENQPKYYRRR